MAHESFEDNKTAEILNKHFISIKVDREERPDIDSVYMSVCQAFTGSGGWPMSIFMTWDKKPFFTGTYFPPLSRYGMPGFLELLNTIAKRWNTNQADLLESAEEIITHLKNTESTKNSQINSDLIQRAVQIFEHTFDNTHGGFGDAPKFPTPHNLLFLMLYAKQNNNSDALKMAEKTLMQMRKHFMYVKITVVCPQPMRYLPSERNKNLIISFAAKKNTVNAFAPTVFFICM